VEVGLDEVRAILARRDARGDNYVELSAAGTLYPMLGLYLHDGLAVVLRIQAEEGPVRILEGDGSVPASDTVRFRDPSSDDMRFTGGVVVRAATAVRCAEAFAGEGTWPPDLRWELQ
jgi:hypothetical protein